MRLIDNRGKLFGIINAFDLSVIVIFLVTATFVLSFQYKHRKDKALKLEVAYHHVYRRVVARAYMLPEVADRIKKGSNMVDSKGKAICEVMDIISNKPAFFEAVAKGLDVEPELSIHEKKYSYLVGSEPDGNMFLGEAQDVVKSSIVLSSLRVLDVSFKVLCRIERDGTVLSVHSGAPLLVGMTFDFMDKRYGYTVRFTLIDIAEEEL